MRYKEFLNQLEINKGLELVFRFEGNDINKDYHITEVLKSTVEAIDCGGKTDKWEETILQLIEPKQTDAARHMFASKAHKILEKSAQAISYDNRSTIILEFKPVGTIAAQRFSVSSVEAVGGSLVVHSSGATTQCKALARKSNRRTNSCCESASRENHSKCSA